jgi:hypothetical protein
MNNPNSTSYGGPLRRALISSLIIFVLSILVVDFWQTAILSELGLLLFWLFALIVKIRRPKEPTPTDLWLIGWGIWPFIICFHVAVHVVWHLRGLE